MAPGRAKTAPISHDMALFERLKLVAQQHNPDVRSGSMFGSPSLFLGKRMIGCVFGSAIALKVPAAVAQEALAEAGAKPFRPYGKPAMREWIEIDSGTLKRRYDLLEQAIRFAEPG